MKKPPRKRSGSILGSRFHVLFKHYIPIIYSFSERKLLFFEISITTMKHVSTKIINTNTHIHVSVLIIAFSFRIVTVTLCTTPFTV
jgi:hypothetical protein